MELLNPRRVGAVAAVLSTGAAIAFSLVPTATAADERTGVPLPHPRVSAQVAAPSRTLPETVLEGDLEVLYEDSAGASRLLHYLNSGGQRISLQFLSDPPGLLTGTRVRVRGTLVNATLMVVSGSASVQTIAPALDVRVCLNSACVDGASYRRHDSVAIQVNVASGSSTLPGASITLSITKPRGGTTRLSGKTGTDGSATFKFRVKLQDPTGLYRVTATTNANGVNGISSATFTVGP